MDEGSSGSSRSLSSDDASSIQSVSSAPNTPQAQRTLSAAPSLLSPAASPSSLSLRDSPARSPLSSLALTERISDHMAEDTEYEAKHDTSYSAKAMNFIIEASLVRYNLRRLNGSRFLIKAEGSDNPNKCIAFIPAIEIGGQFSCVADYFKETPVRSPSKSSSSSPMSPGSNMQRPSDLWQELRPLFSENNLVIKIFYPYATHSNSWVIGEITITKNANQFQIDIAIYDPLNIARLEPIDHAGIKDHVIQEILKINNSAYIQSSAREKRITMLSPDDVVSSGVMATEILLSLAGNIELQQLARDTQHTYRKLQLQSVLKHYGIQDPQRKRFISSYARPAAQSARILTHVNAETRLITYGSGDEKYLPQITEAQDQYFLQHANSIEIRKINIRAAFEAAKTGNVMLLQALLGLMHDEDLINEQLEALAKESYALTQDKTEIRFKIAVIEMQTKLIGEYLDKPQVDRNPDTLKETITSQIDHIANEIVEDFFADYAARKKDEEVMINMRYLKMSELSGNDLNDHKAAFRDRLLAYKTTFITGFNPHELNTLYSNLQQHHAELFKSFESLQKIITGKNLEFSTLSNLLISDVITHRQNAGRFWKLRRETLPDFFPKDEFGFWSHILFARVPIHQRDEPPICNTLLHVAWLYGHRNVARLLLARGADPEAKNNQQRTPYELRNEPKHKLIALSQHAPLLSNQESEFVRRVKELRTAYLSELTSQENSNGIFGALVKKFVDTDLLAERRRTLETLGTLIELAVAECNDAFLAKWIMDLLKAHFNGKFVHLKDSLPINGTDFFQKLAAVYNGIISTKRHDFNAIRLPSNFEQFLLERSVYTEHNKLIAAEAQLRITTEENHRLKTERDEARQRLEQETRLRIELEQQLEEERRRTAEERQKIEERLKDNEELRRIAATSTEVPLPSSRPRSGSLPTAIIASGSPIAPPLGQNRHILLSSSTSASAAHAESIPPPLVGTNTIAMQQFSPGTNNGKPQ